MDYIWEADDLFLGLDLGGTNAVLGLVNGCGKVLAEATLPTSSFPTVQAFVKAAVSAVGQLADALGGRQRIKAMGIGAPNGNFFRATMVHAVNIQWARGEEIPLASLFENHLKVPVVLTNDANAAALGEQAYGAARGMENFIVLTLGTGVGAGIVVNGQLVYGVDGMAGELGHFTVRRDGGRPCGCGRNGCLETYCSATGVARTAVEWLETETAPSILRERDPKSITSLDVARAAQDGDELALRILARTGEILGQACADFATFCSPEAFIFAGGLANAGALLLKPAELSYDAHVMAVYRGKARFLPTELGSARAALLGAALLGRNQLEGGAQSDLQKAEKDKMRR